MDPELRKKLMLRGKKDSSRRGFLFGKEPDQEPGQEQEGTAAAGSEPNVVTPNNSEPDTSAAAAAGMRNTGTESNDNSISSRHSKGSFASKADDDSTSNVSLKDRIRQYTALKQEGAHKPDVRDAELNEVSKNSPLQRSRQSFASSSHKRLAQLQPPLDGSTHSASLRPVKISPKPPQNNVPEFMRKAAQLKSPGGASFLTPTPKEPAKTAAVPLPPPPITGDSPAPESVKSVDAPTGAATEEAADVEATPAEATPAEATPVEAPATPSATDEAPPTTDEAPSVTDAADETPATTNDADEPEATAAESDKPSDIAQSTHDASVASEIPASTMATDIVEEVFDEEIVDGDSLLEEELLEEEEVVDEEVVRDDDEDFPFESSATDLDAGESWGRPASMTSLLDGSLSGAGRTRMNQRNSSFDDDMLMDETLQIDSADSRSKHSQDPRTTPSPPMQDPNGDLPSLSAAKRSQHAETDSPAPEKPKSGNISLANTATSLPGLEDVELEADAEEQDMDIEEQYESDQYETENIETEQDETQHSRVSEAPPQQQSIGQFSASEGSDYQEIPFSERYLVEEIVDTASEHSQRGREPGGSISGNSIGRDPDAAGAPEYSEDIVEEDDVQSNLEEEEYFSESDDISTKDGAPKAHAEFDEDGDTIDEDTNQQDDDDDDNAAGIAVAAAAAVGAAAVAGSLVGGVQDVPEEGSSGGYEDESMSAADSSRPSGGIQPDSMTDRSQPVSGSTRSGSSTSYQTQQQQQQQQQHEQQQLQQQHEPDHYSPHNEEKFEEEENPYEATTPRGPVPATYGGGDTYVDDRHIPRQPDLPKPTTYEADYNSDPFVLYNGDPQHDSRDPNQPQRPRRNRGGGAMVGDVGRTGRRSQNHPDEEEIVFEGFNDEDDRAGGAAFVPAPLGNDDFGSKDDGSKARLEARARRNFRVIMAGIIILALLAIAAIVVPLLLDDCDCPDTQVRTLDVPTESPSVTLPTEVPTMRPTKPPPPPPPPTGMPTIAPTTDTPSSAPSTSQLKQFVEFFARDISGQAVFDDRSTPQFQAADFLIERDAFKFQLLSPEELRDRYALVVLYYSTNGDSWSQCSRDDATCTDPDNGPWLEGSVCQWFGVRCEADGRIRDVVFSSNNGLVGTLPPELSIIDELEIFAIVDNRVSGTLPEAFATSMTSLEQIILFGTELSGEIPTGAFAQSPIDTVVLERNRFSGNLGFIGNPLTLSRLRVSDNQFDGVIPNLSSYQTLTVLELRGNNFSGNIPESLGSARSLQEIDVSNNSLQGGLPQSIASLQNLREFNFDNNNLSGSVSNAICSLGLLELTADCNEITCTCCTQCFP